ncbi:MAG TPA: stage II sporulation protein P [Candidatus Scatomonas merdavium]|nr:stage II sporulation protein P [Candidatus Scatomonas merdavium]
MIRQRLEEENRKKAAEQENQQAAEQNDSQEGQTASESPEGSQSGQTASGSQDSGQNGQTASGSQDSGQSGQMASGSQDSSQNGQDVQETSGTSRWQDQLQPTAEIPLESLQNYDYLLNEFFVVDPNTTTDSSQINVEELMGRDMTLEKDSGQPQILIYHTHSQEEFVDSVAGDVNTTVIGVGEHLAQILRDEYGYQVIHNTDTFDLVDGQLDRSKAYNYAEPVITQILNENPSIEIVIDLHRDGVDESKHLVTEVNGKPTAQVMFFNGLSRTAMNGNLDYLPNPYIEDNLAFSFQLEYLAKQYFPDYTRCIYLKGYRYNLHVRPRSLLLEVGAQTNTVEEAMNAMEPFAWLLNRVLQGG